MSKNTLYDKVWDAHVVDRLPTGQYQLFIGLHLTHEVTTPQAYDMIRERGLDVAFLDRTVATVDHISPTDDLSRPFQDVQAEAMMRALEDNVRRHNVRFFDFASGKQGIVHVIGPELGLVHPGMTVACGDSHTATHGAFGTLAFGIGTTQVRDVLASQCLSLDRLGVRRVEVNGTLGHGVEAKDVTLYIIRKLGVNGGIGLAYEYAGDVIENMTMEGRMTVCNMAIEGGARVGYVNPDQTTFDYLQGREYAPSEAEWDTAVAHWQSLCSDSDAEYDDKVSFNGADIGPTVTWGINPGQSVAVDEALPSPEAFDEADRPTVKRAYEHMGFKPGQKITDAAVDVVFIGSCTNSRISDLRTAAAIARGNKVAKGVKALVVPGSQQVAAEAEAEGLHEIFQEAGFEWRNAGCSMCLGMNTDKLVGNQMSASTSNRNFIGRQGSPTGRTLLLSPSMAAAAAISGHITDVREMG